VRAYLTEQRGARILGIEIAPTAVSVATLPFSGPTAFILGNEGSGLSPAQCAVCDGFVYIPQHGPGTASLNVAVAAGIVLHRFSEWACYAEAGRDAEHPGKFGVAPRPQRTAPRGVVPEQDVGEVRAARAAAREAREAAAAQAVGGLLDGELSDGRDGTGGDDGNGDVGGAGGAGGGGGSGLTAINHM
jgi:hypothetical protein